MNTITLPVVAHRIYGIGHSEGTVWERVPSRNEDRIWLNVGLPSVSEKPSKTPSASPRLKMARRPPEDRRTVEVREEWELGLWTRVRYVAPGTRRDIDEIRDFFDGARRASTTGEENVNQLWSQAGISFRLIAIIDQGLPVFQSLAVSTDYVKTAVRELNTPRVVNVYFFRDLIGALGVASTSPCPIQEMYRSIPFAAIEDWEQVGQSWSRAVRVLGHELGHLLNVSHVEDIENLMYPWDNESSRALTATQTVMARHHAGQYKENIIGLCSMDPIFRKLFTDPDEQPAMYSECIYGRLEFGNEGG